MEDRGDLFMLEAMREARLAGQAGEVPVGAVLVRSGEILARGHNRRERDGDPTAHAEVVVLRAAARRLGRWRLDGCRLYVTLEPCAMCAGALVNARVAELVFGAFDPKGGFCGSLGDIVGDSRLNHRLRVRGGVRADDCASLLVEFFAARRRGGRGLDRAVDRRKGTER